MDEITPQITELKEVLQSNPVATDLKVEVPPTPQETPDQIQDRNWKQFREARDQERKQREAAEKIAREKEAEATALKAAMDAILNRQPQNQQQQQYQNDEYESEDVKIQKKVDQALAERDKRFEQERVERERKEYPDRLKSAYRDFDQVCNADNLDYLDYHYPEVSRAFSAMPDGFDKWASVYQACKRFIPNSVNAKQDMARAEKNMSKPQSMSVAGATATGDNAPYKLDDKRKADNWARMQKVRRGV